MKQYLNAFPGYECVIEKEFNEKLGVYKNVLKNMYRGDDVGKGGWVYSEPGIYTDVALLDVASMHPHSMLALNNLGDEGTAKLQELIDIRLAIKHKEYDKVRNMMGGKLAKYVEDEKSAKQLSTALKLPINGLYGLTSASFPNVFKDPRNENNIVALRGALFMRTLQDEVKAKGFTVAHIKTDSIKIPNATQEIIDFVFEFGKKYDYTFEHEATYDRICLINKAEYIAKYKDGKHIFKLPTGEEIETEWTATGKTFQIPYVFKTLFSHTPIIFEDKCETFAVKSEIYVDMNENLPDVSAYEKSKAKLKKIYDEDPQDSIKEELDKLDAEIAKGHNYVFVGKVGQFCPMKPGSGGGQLVAFRNGKYDAVQGTKGYRWMESVLVKELGLEDQIDLSFYREIVDNAVEEIKKLGDFDAFISDNPYKTKEDFMKVVEGAPEELPFI